MGSYVSSFLSRNTRAMLLLGAKKTVGESMWETRDHQLRLSFLELNVPVQLQLLPQRHDVRLQERPHLIQQRVVLVRCSCRLRCRRLVGGGGGSGDGGGGGGARMEQLGWGPLLVGKGQ